MKKPKRPRDTNQLAKSIVDLATGEAEEPKPVGKKKDPAAVALGRKGGLKGGKARAESLTEKERKAIATKAAKTRWQRHSEDEPPEADDEASGPKRRRQVLKTPRGT